MSEPLHIELSDFQRDILLKGLRYVRSSRMMEFRDLQDKSGDEEKAEIQRRDELGEIRHLVELLDRKTRKGEPAAV
ncbi:hypothetical protein GC163_19410 [bacterium]|nr:hypothetical protein [bacterium]